MADRKVTELTTITSLADADLFLVTDDPGGTPASRSLRVDALRSDIETNANTPPYYAITAAETTAGVTPVNYGYEPLDIRRYNAIGDDATDNYTAIQNAIDVAEVSGGEVYIPEGVFRFATGLTNTSNITIRGAAVEKSILKKVGSINGLTITGNPSSVFTRFTLDATGDSTGIGIFAKSNARGRYSELLVQNHGSHGIQVGNAEASESNNLSTFRDIKSLSNGGDGLRIEGEATPNANGMHLSNLDLRANTGYGLNVVSAWANQYYSVTTQSNTAGGQLFTSCRQSFGVLYSENNTGNDIELATGGNCKSNFFIVTVGDSSTSLVDSATARANMLLGMKHQATFEPNFHHIMTDEIHISAERSDNTDYIGNLTLSHTADYEYTIELAGTGAAGGQWVKLINSNAGGDAHLYVDGKLGSGASVANANTPSGATAYALPWYDEAGTLLGYIPVYASQW